MSRRSVRSIAGLAVTGVTVMAACGGASSNSSSTTASSGAPSTSMAAGSGSHSGSATATVSAGGKTLTFHGGTCHTGKGVFYVQIGTAPPPGAATSGMNYFGLTVGAVPQPDGSTVGQAVNGDGTYTIGVMVGTQGGVSINATTNPQVTLSGGMTKGTISGGATVVQGSSLQQGLPLTGSFSC